MKGRSIKKSLWGTYWKLHDQKKRFAARLKGWLDGLPEKTRKRIVLAMFAVFALLALYTFGKAVYDIGRNDGKRIEINHIERLELPAQPEGNKNFIKPYEHGTTEK